jgi:GrpB-like predicted nucleotidyltransferase (UPF0157 family)
MPEKKKLTPEQREVELVPHNPEWEKLANQEVRNIQDCLSIPIIGIYHIGSTSVPDIKAKPILDFVMEVKDIEKLIQEAHKLEGIGYVSRGEYGIPGRQFFTKDTNGERTHHLHVFQQGHPDIERHLVFRDYLRANPEAAREYEILKEQLAERFPDQSNKYTEAKSNFILSMDEVARYWLEQKGFKGKIDRSES